MASKLISDEVELLRFLGWNGEGMRYRFHILSSGRATEASTLGSRWFGSAVRLLIGRAAAGKEPSGAAQRYEDPGKHDYSAWETTFSSPRFLCASLFIKYFLLGGAADSRSDETNPM